jgi:hypothetical protein
MLCYGSDSGKDPESLLFRNILHFHKGILIGPVAVNAAQDAAGAVSPHLRQPLGRKLRYPSTIRRDSDQYQILLLESAVSQLRVCQVYGLYTRPPRVGDRFCDPHGPPGGAENQLYAIHKGPSSCNV